MFKRSVQQQLLSYHYSGLRKAKGNKLNLFGKAIVVIDKVKEPQSLTGIREMDLSHNGISEIQNIDQFSSVEFINLSHNRIIEAEEVLKLQKLPRLDTLYLKGNPFLRDKMDGKVVAFLLSIDTDVEIVSGEVSSLISSFANKTLQNLCYSHYLRRIENHIQLLNSYNMDQCFLNPDYAIFPKIKKLFQQNLKEMSIKRQLIEWIDKRCFEDEGALTEYLKGRIDAVQNERSEIIRKIYERQQLLRNMRSTYNLRVVPKKKIPRIMNGPVTVGYFSPPKLKESRKQSKIGTTNTKPKVKSEQIQNSPPKKLSQSLQWRQGYQEQVLLNTLIKMNPLYQLLQSPLPSLKSHEKQLLIQNLSLHLKEKMKEVQKLEKKEQQLYKIKMEMNDLQQHLREVSIEFKNQQQKGNQKIKKLSNLCKEDSERVENLCQQLTACQEELQTLKTENSRLKCENTGLKQKIQLYQFEEQLQETIKDHFSKKLKKNYIQLLSKKAYQLSRLRQIKQLNKNVQQRQLKQLYFHELQYATRLAKYQNRLTKTQKSKSLRQLIEVLNNNRVNNIKQQTLSSHLSKQNMRYFIIFLQQNDKKSKIHNEKIQKAKNISNKRTKTKIFLSMKQQLQQKYEQIYNESLQRQSCLIVIRKTFRVWKKYLSSHIQKMTQCQSQIIKGTKHYYFNLFTSRCSQRLLFLASSQATQDFLCKIRKIKCYLNFTKTTSAAISQRKIKCRKVELIRQHQYLFWFMSTIRDFRVKKRILAQHQLHLKKQNQKQRQKQQKQSKQNKLNKRLIFCNRLQIMSFKVINKILNRQKTTISLENDKHQSVHKQFFAFLRTNWLNSYKLNVKIDFLRKSPVIVNKIKSFFKCLSAEKIKLMRFKSKSNKDKLLKCFYKWKFFNSWSKMLAYKQMYEQLGPEISHVSELQRQVARERQLLLLQIEQKQRILRDWQHKCEDYKYMIHSKDLKYQKLKDIYAEMANQQQMNATVKLAKEKKPQEDIYLKYLPQERKIQPTTQYSFQGKLGERDDYLKGRLYTQNQNFRADITKQSEKLGSYMKNRETFLSSFKRF